MKERVSGNFDYTASITYPGGRRIEMQYDELDRLSLLGDDNTTATLASYSYTGAARVARRDFMNGTRWALEYDGLSNAVGDFGDRQVTRSTHSVIAGGAIVDDRSFTWGLILIRGEGAFQPCLPSEWRETIHWIVSPRNP